jgi:maltoporin
VSFAQDAPVDPPPRTDPPKTDPPPDAPKPDAPKPDAPKPDAPPDGPATPPEPPPKAEQPAPPKEPAAAPAIPPPPAEKPHEGSFQFGMYGRVVAATDGHGGPGADSELVARGSRMDEDNYAEIELRREDHWETTGIKTAIVVTLAMASPVFHYAGKFDLNAAIRNLYLEARDIGTKGLAAFAGSKMVRGDDIYLLDWWPLDNLNILGGGFTYKHPVGFFGQLTVGATQPDVPFFKQTVLRPAPLDQFGASTVPFLNRQKLIGALKVGFNHTFGADPTDETTRANKPGVKAFLYGEGHALAEGEREREPGGPVEQLPSDGGFVAGGQFTAYTGQRNTFIHLFFRYAGNLAAFGQWGAPGQLTEQRTSEGARELIAAVGGNVEYDFFGLLLGGYFRSFRDPTPVLNYEDVDEGVVAIRPSVWFGDIAGLSLEGSFQVAQRGVLYRDPEAPLAPAEGPALASYFRVGIIPFITPAGRGSFTRPHIRAMYNIGFRNSVAQLLYPEDHPYRERDIEHFIGLGAEWWFNSYSYGF